jgi:hypothetical protein
VTPETPEGITPRAAFYADLEALADREEEVREREDVRQRAERDAAHRQDRQAKATNIAAIAALRKQRCPSPRCCWGCWGSGIGTGIRTDTVGQPPSTEIGVLNMSSWKAKKLRKLPQEKVLLEL